MKVLHVRNAVAGAAGEIEPALVHPQRRRKDPSSTLHRSHIELRLSIERMSNQFPKGEILAVVYRETGVVFESRSNEKVVLTDADTGWVRVATGDDGV